MCLEKASDLERRKGEDPGGRRRRTDPAAKGSVALKRSWNKWHKTVFRQAERKIA